MRAKRPDESRLDLGEGAPLSKINRNAVECPFLKRVKRSYELFKILSIFGHNPGRFCLILIISNGDDLVIPTFVVPRVITCGICRLIPAIAIALT